MPTRTLFLALGLIIVTVVLIIIALVGARSTNLQQAQKPLDCIITDTATQRIITCPK